MNKENIPPINALKVDKSTKRNKVPTLTPNKENGQVRPWKK
jgi:hypothetical protein